ncbi:hypothetical protein HNQ59_001141 [Chitinivorax tropicus]|uniref:Uncharacterized protein n=1 Tax=Chitinivorax tropicus TaxID=714531 RepID=A0A840MRM5_9PROT|nr:hypothetical protein [Chitinivorax tropicus]MBB5017871.1 hypothetical protein [Chitinivorax tropicus]
MEFDEVKPEHFGTISRNPFPHVLIDRALMQIAGGGTAASDFHKRVIAAAGWKHHNLVPFGKHPQEAAQVYNKIRAVLAHCSEDAEAILKALGA